MKTVNMHEAKTHLSKLVDAAVAGEPFIIAKAGKPMVKVEPITEAPKKLRRLGFMPGGPHHVPDELFSPAADKEIEELFYGIGDGDKFAGLDFPFPKPDDPDQQIHLSADEYREKFGDGK